ncbi:SRPBCC family protein [Gallaecimonas kandeliae]|uniref:SRPBCC family protein n=1 Tax=Gallaecimonas kandeliae TaxID=3029055 RepID=UPI00264A0CD8|nr:SRPBCC family protein [Gallaecimonas kandeliae]WKE65584.1 SRPBCC family protein [Gallaecimonas kandeliae]
MIWLKRIVTALVLLVVILLVVGLFLPREVQVERSIHIDAKPQSVFTKVTDLTQFNQWSPWYGLDPSARYEISGKAGERGHKLAWQSDKPDVGSGSMTLIEFNAPGYVAMKLDFAGQGQADSYFRIRPEQGGSDVTWGFRTNFGNDLVGRYVGLFMDSILGRQYEEGLAKLKKVLERRA